MTPVETLWIALTIIFGVVGLVRGFLKELGVTLVLIVTLFGLTRLAANMGRILDLLASVSRMNAIRGLAGNELLMLLLYTGMFLAAVFIAYQGYVITYPGGEPKGLQGTLLRLMVGLINGYLVAGSLWYYVDKFQQPVRAASLLQGSYTTLAQRLLPLLPPVKLDRFLPFLVVFMIILLVLK